MRGSGNARLALASAIGGLLLAPGVLFADGVPPSAAIEVAPSSPVAGEPVRLDATDSAGDLVTYRWDLDGDGTFESKGGPVVERELEAGSHRVGVQVADSTGATDQQEATVTVAPQPKAYEPKPAEPRKAPKPKPVAQAAGANAVTIKNFAYAPASVTVSPGDTVTWTNQDSAPHTATGKGFDTGTLNKGQSGSHTFSSSGSFSYICSIHPNMKGTVVVK